MAKKLPKNRNKSLLGLLVILAAAAILLFVTVVAGRISSQNAIAPNAPTSEPAAYDPAEMAKACNPECGNKQCCRAGKCTFNCSLPTPTAKKSPTPTIKTCNPECGNKQCCRAGKCTFNCSLPTPSR